MREPFYADSLTTLYHGDCLEVMAGLEPQSFDAVICDPPYGTTACAWDSVIPFAPMWAAIRRLVKSSAAIVLFGQEPFSSFLRVSNIEWFKYDWIWSKSRPSGFLDANRKPLNDHEIVSVFYELQPIYHPQMWKGKPNHIAEGRISGARKASQYGSYNNLPRFKTDDKYPRKTLYFDSLDPAAMLHPTQKPLDLLEYLVRTYTNEGDRVLDFTAGSGTTLRACRNLRRSSVGIEQDRHYCDVTVKRLAPTFEEAIVDNGAPLDALPLFAQEVAE
jgi:DNA modification methylase